MKFPPALVSRSTGVFLFSPDVLLSMGMMMCID